MAHSAGKSSDSSCCRLEGKLFTGVQLERIFDRSSQKSTECMFC